MNRFLRFLEPFFKFVTILENVLCAGGLFLTTFMTFFQVMNRYWLRFEIIWLNDVTLFIFIFFMFFAIPLTTREGQHTGVDVFVKSMFGDSPAGFVAFNAFLKLVSIGTIVVFMIPSWSFALRAFKYPQYATLVRWFNTSWLMESLFFCLGLCVLHLLYELVLDLVKMKNLRSAGEGR